MGLPLSRTQSDPGPSAGQVETGGAMYPDLSGLAEEAKQQQQRVASPVPSPAPTPAPVPALGKGKEVFAAPSPRRASSVPSPRMGSPGLPQRVASPIMGSPANAHPASSPADAQIEPQRTASPASVFAPRAAPVTHIGQPQRVVDVSMAMDIEPPTPSRNGVSQAWRESVPEEPQDDDGVSVCHSLPRDEE